MFSEIGNKIRILEIYSYNKFQVKVLADKSRETKDESKEEKEV